MISPKAQIVRNRICTAAVRHLCTLSLVLVLLSCGFPANAAAGIAPFIETEAAPTSFRKGTKLFEDRDYVASEIPAFLDGYTLLRSRIDEVKIHARTGGEVYALTPKEHPNAASQGKALRESGFAKMDISPVQLFAGEINQVEVYSRMLKDGERLAFRKWVVLVLPKEGRAEVPLVESQRPWYQNDGELLYNGIRLPREWPPRTQDFDSTEPMQVPYLRYPPSVINIDVGRQLFVDDFLIEFTTLERVFHQPEKYRGNPVLKPETDLERQGRLNAVAAPFGDGIFYDPDERLFKMWYHAGWFDGTALATSSDGIKWSRPSLSVEPGTNLVIPGTGERRRDGSSLWLDLESKESDERFKLLLYARTGQLGQELQGGEVSFHTSGDGVNWTLRHSKPSNSDNTTVHYNPFRKKWVFAPKVIKGWSRVRHYWESSSFLNVETWSEEKAVPWIRNDRLDKPDPRIGEPAQIYKIDAVAYESLMLGLVQILYGPENNKAAIAGQPKITDLAVAFSRDGFHWDRTNREPFIASARTKDCWDRGYVGSSGGVCVVSPDKIFFYYSGFAGGDGRRTWQQNYWSEMYANGATGLAILRRDGFASMEAGKKPETLTTRPLAFSGNHLFVNVSANTGEMRVEILGQDGKPISPYTKENCMPVTVDKTKVMVLWKGAVSLEPLHSRNVRFRFYLRDAKIFSFWVSRHLSGESEGFLAAGGPGYSSNKDVR